VVEEEEEVEKNINHKLVDKAQQVAGGQKAIPVGGAFNKYLSMNQNKILNSSPKKGRKASSSP
jgi:hypothetical protein